MKKVNEKQVRKNKVYSGLADLGMLSLSDFYCLYSILEAEVFMGRYMMLTMITRNKSKKIKSTIKSLKISHILLFIKVKA